MHVPSRRVLVACHGVVPLVIPGGRQSPARNGGGACSAGIAEPQRTIVFTLESFVTGLDDTTGEAQAITGDPDENKAAQKLAAKPGAITVLKRGPAGCTIYHQDKKICVPGFSVTEVDPTGAGDCFSAAFIAGLESGWPLEQVGRFANAAGALAVTRLGPMEGAPTRKQVESLYAG